MAILAFLEVVEDSQAALLSLSCLAASTGESFIMEDLLRRMYPELARKDRKPRRKVAALKCLVAGALLPHGQTVNNSEA